MLRAALHYLPGATAPRTPPAFLSASRWRCLCAVSEEAQAEVLKFLTAASRPKMGLSKAKQSAGQRALDLSKSTYCTTFARLCKEVFTARLEANDNMKYLRTLEVWFDQLNNVGEDNFTGLLELFKPMLHIILLLSLIHI